MHVPQQLLQFRAGDDASLSLTDGRAELQAQPELLLQETVVAFWIDPPPDDDAERIVQVEEQGRTNAGCCASERQLESSSRCSALRTRSGTSAPSKSARRTRGALWATAIKDEFVQALVVVGQQAGANRPGLPVRPVVDVLALGVHDEVPIRSLGELDACLRQPMRGTRQGRWLLRRACQVLDGQHHLDALVVGQAGHMGFLTADVQQLRHPGIGLAAIHARRRLPQRIEHAVCLDARGAQILVGQASHGQRAVADELFPIRQRDPGTPLVAADVRIAAGASPDVPVGQVFPVWVDLGARHKLDRRMTVRAPFGRTQPNTRCDIDHRSGGGVHLRVDGLGRDGVLYKKTVFHASPMSAHPVEVILSSTLLPAKQLELLLPPIEVAMSTCEAVQEPLVPAAEPRPSSHATGPADGVLASPAQNAASAAVELPPELADHIWRGAELGQGRAGFVGTGFAALDAELPDGGWPCGGMVEILQSHPSLLEWRMVGPSLAPLVKGGRSVVVIGPPKPPYLPGLRHLGLNEDCLVWIKADKPSDRLWSAELLLRANAAAAVLAWLPHCLPGQLRRLQVAAQGCEGPVFVFRPLDARYDSSPAPLRLVASELIDWQLKVEIIKRRGPAHETPLLLDSIPGGLNHVLTPRMRRPSLIVRNKEARRHVVGRPHNPAHAAAARLAQEVLARAAASHG